MRIRDLVPQDAEKLVAFREALFGETDFLLYGPGECSTAVEEVTSQIERTSQDRTARSLIAESDDLFIGFLNIRGSPVPRLRHSAHIGLGVARAWWGRGVATALLNEVFRWAPTVRITRLELSVMTTNGRALALYERLGFKFEGVRRRAYVVNGVAVDDHIMAYNFEA